jgi:hypothetical protein
MRKKNLREGRAGWMIRKLRQFGKYEKMRNEEIIN